MQNVYLLHGLLGTCYSHFADQIKAWRDDYRLVPIDLPGHGRSRKDAARPYYREAVELLRQHLAQIGPGHVIGISYLGGSVALRCALLYPELLRSLVLTGYVSEVPQQVIDSWAGAFFTLARQRPALAQEYEAMHGSRWQHTLEIVTTEIREEYATAIAVPPSLLATLKVPTLVVNGSIKSDERAAAVEFPLHNPLVEAGLIPGAGHIASHDQPEIFNLMIEQFWKRIEDQNYAS